MRVLSYVGLVLTASLGMASVCTGNGLGIALSGGAMSLIIMSLAYQDHRDGV